MTTTKVPGNLILTRNLKPMTTGTVITHKHSLKTSPDPSKELFSHVLTTNPAISVAQLISLAKTVALGIAKNRKYVTSVDVFAALKTAGIDTHAHDPRWMGKVFSKRDGWKRVRTAKIGSHKRPVSVWCRK